MVLPLLPLVGFAIAATILKMPPMVWAIIILAFIGIIVIGITDPFELIALSLIGAFVVMTVYKK